MAGGVNALGNLLGKTNANNAIVVTLDGGTATASQFVGPAGDTAASPAFTSADDLTTGMFATADDIRFAIDGTTRWIFAGQILTATSIDGSGFTLGSTGPVTLQHSATVANQLDLATGDSFNLVDGALIMGGPGGATSSTKKVKKVTGIADAVATAVFTVTVPNANHAAFIEVKLLSSNGSTDAFESARVAVGVIAVTRTAGVATVAVAAALTSAAIATVAAGATHTLAYSVSAMTGAAGATQTFTINVTIDDSGNLGSNQVNVLAEIMNSEATGITLA